MPHKKPIPQERSLMRLDNDERGQATVEYALVMVAAATVALALILWAANTSVLPELFDAAIARVKALGS